MPDKIISLFNHKIYVGENALRKLDSFLNSKENKDKEKVILVDENTAAQCLPVLRKSISTTKDFHVIQINSGEKNKNLNAVYSIVKILTQHQVSRNAILVNLGGGMICDIGGFTASVYKRGIPFINVPTSLLGMIDASIGGKTGVDLEDTKNTIGTFNFPTAVFTFPGFLKTLHVRELRSGLAELLKHAIIADSKLWKQLCNSDLLNSLKQNHVHAAIHIKSGIVAKDPYEINIRRRLNFGHTIGHAIETYSLKHDGEHLLHGQAVAIGMICEAYLSHRMLGFKEEELNQIITQVKKYFTKYFTQQIDLNELLLYMSNDKKNDGKGINFSLLKKIGEPVINVYCDQELIRESIKFYTSLSFS